MHALLEYQCLAVLAEHPGMDLTAAPFWNSFCCVGEGAQQAWGRAEQAVKLQSSFRVRVELRGQPLMLHFM